MYNFPKIEEFCHENNYCIFIDMRLWEGGVPRSLKFYSVKLINYYICCLERQLCNKQNISSITVS